MTPIKVRGHTCPGMEDHFAVGGGCVPTIGASGEIRGCDDVNYTWVLFCPWCGEKLPPAPKTECYIPVNDGFGVVGYSWNCRCGAIHTYVAAGEKLPCGNTVTEEDPDDWYDREMAKPVMEREWNRD